MVCNHFYSSTCVICSKMTEIGILSTYETAINSQSNRLAFRNGSESDSVAIKDDQSAGPSVSCLGKREIVNESNPCDSAPTIQGKLLVKKKHRRRRSQSKRWKPYHKLTWDEKKEKDDMETKKANRKRERRFAEGHPVAPYNTTQFLMEDHNVQSPDYLKMVSNEYNSTAKTNLESSEEYYSMPVDDEEDESYMQREFCDIYDVINAERLESMSKNQLIQEYLQLDDRVEQLEKKLKKSAIPFHSRTYSTSTIDSEVQTWDMEDDEETEKIRIFQEEIRKLAKENAKLKEENRRLMMASEAEPSGDVINLDVDYVVYKEVSSHKSEQSEKELSSDSESLSSGRCEPSSTLTANSPIHDGQMSENLSDVVNSHSSVHSHESSLTESEIAAMDETANISFPVNECSSVSSTGDVKM